MPTVSEGVGGFLTAALTLTNAQILALPTARVQIVPAPGAGRTLVPLMVLLVKSFAAAAYTNVDATARLRVAFGTSATPAGAETIGSISDSNYTFFGAAVFETYTIPNGANEDGNGGVFPAAGEDLRNLPLSVSVTNGALGNLTGGNVANSLAATVYYAVA